MEIVKENAVPVCPLFGAQVVPAVPSGNIAQPGQVGLMPVNHPCQQARCMFWGVAADPGSKNGEGLEEDGCIIVAALRQYTRRP